MGLRMVSMVMGVQGARPNHFPCGEPGGCLRHIGPLGSKWGGWLVAAEQVLLKQRDMQTPPKASALQTVKQALGTRLRLTQPHPTLPLPPAGQAGPHNVSCSVTPAVPCRPQ